MKLNNNGLLENTLWENAGYILPKFDRQSVNEKTKLNPSWIHFGGGNIFRAFQAKIVQDLLNKNILDTGLIMVEGYDYEIIEKINNPHDNLAILVTLKSDGKIEKTVIASVIESLCLDRNKAEEFNRLKEIFKNPSLQMASFTITEKGYNLFDGNGVIYDNIKNDYINGPKYADSYLGKISSLLYERYLNNQLPIAMVSMDNCSHNGTKLYEAISAFAREWCKRGLCKEGFTDYINNPSKVSFPWTMIDKITPRPDERVKEILKKDKIDDLDEIITTKGTYTAPFVNAEESEYLVIEDSFPNKRPPLEKAGVIFTEKETVDRVEKMKVCTCLNPLHTALAVFGCLLDYQLISQEMKNPILKRMVEIIGYEEGLLVVTNPGIINPKEFLDEVINVRIPNPFMPDTPWRIATDTSQKLAIRFGETIKEYQKREDLKVEDLKIIPLVFAGWIRYLMGINDKGERFKPSLDPLLETVSSYVKDLELGKDGDFEESLKPLLQDAKIFGVDLYEVGLAKDVILYFTEMVKEVGAVQKTLEKYIE